MRYVDIIILAINIHQKMSDINCENPNPIKVISSDSNDIKKSVLSYWDHDPIDLSVRLTKTLDLNKRGMFRLYKKQVKNINRKSIINISQELNECWRRFVTTKELVHLVLATNPSTWTCSTLHGIEEVFDLKEIKLDDDIHLEDLAKLLALELLCPFCYNNYVVESPLSSYQLAEEFMIPEKAIDRIRSSQYQKLRIDAYKDL